MGTDRQRGTLIACMVHGWDVKHHNLWYTICFWSYLWSWNSFGVARKAGGLEPWKCRKLQLPATKTLGPLSLSSCLHYHQQKAMQKSGVPCIFICFCTPSSLYFYHTNLCLYWWEVGNTLQLPQNPHLLLHHAKQWERRERIWPW